MKRRDVWAQFRVRVTVRLELAPALHRCEVIEAIEGLRELRALRAWTIHQLSVHMAQREYKVRAAVGWLVHQGRVVAIGSMEQVNALTGRKYAVAMYELLDEAAPLNWVGLYRAFDRKRSA